MTAYLKLSSFAILTDFLYFLYIPIVTPTGRILPYCKSQRFKVHYSTSSFTAFTCRSLAARPKR